MSFELRVEFAGLCLYMVHSDRKSVAILMPDARESADDLHPDGELGEPHVGYVRFDLANLDVPGMSVTPGTLDDGAGSPPNEIVHRFGGEVLDFGLSTSDNEDDEMEIALGIPSFDKFAGTLKPVGKLFTKAPPGELLMRTILTGGRIHAQGSGKTWGLSSALKGSTSAPPYSGQFAGFAVWTRTINQPGLTVTTSRFDGTEVAKIPLKPVNIGGKEVIAIKVANLCANNPLEWDEFPLRTVVNHDLDFKWLYRLLTPPGDPNPRKAYEVALANAELPFPRAMRDQAYGDEDCMGGSITGNFP